MTKLASALATVATLALATQVASADPGDRYMRDPGTATLLSLGGAAASAGVFALGVQQDNPGLIQAGVLSSLVTPSLGEFYAGKYLTWGMGMRAVGGVLTIGGAIQSVGCALDAESSGESARCDDNGLLIIGLAAYAGGIVYDVATAGSAAREYNNKHNLAIAPLALPTSHGPATGIGISGTF